MTLTEKINEAADNIEYVDMNEVMTAERDRIAAAPVAAAVVPVVFSDGAKRSPKMPEVESDQPQPKGTQLR